MKAQKPAEEPEEKPEEKPATQRPPRVAAPSIGDGIKLVPVRYAPETRPRRSACESPTTIGTT